MKIFTLGGGYDIVQTERFILSGELAYLHSVADCKEQQEAGDGNSAKQVCFGM